MPLTAGTEYDTTSLLFRCAERSQVNECEYQAYIVEYLVGCPIAKLPIPYFPTPNNAADACSCNLGEVYLAITGYIQQGAACSTNASTTAITDASDSVQQIQGCECCEVSGSISRFDNTVCCIPEYIAYCE